MKLKKAVDVLTSSYPAELAPRVAPYSWDNWSRQAREVVAENLASISTRAYEVRKTWDFDEEKGHFFFSLTDGIMLEIAPGQRKYATVESTFMLNPAAGLGKEIERLLVEVAAWKEALHRSRRAQLEHVLKTEGEAAFEAARRCGI